MSKVANGFFKLTVYLRPDQYTSLRALALDEAVERGGGRPDASKLIRDMIDLVWPDVEKALKQKRKRRS